MDMMEDETNGTLDLSPAAAAEIRRIMAKQGLDENEQWLRVVMSEIGTKLNYQLELIESIGKQEVTFHSRGVRIACDRYDLPKVSGALIDFKIHGGQDPEFLFEFPSDVLNPDGSPGQNSTPPTEPQVRNALKNVIDPEVGINIVDLGLVYGLAINDRDVHVTMTMTTPACPMHESIKADVNQQICQRNSGVRSVDVQVVWDPPWSPDKISPEAKRQLGWL